MRTFVVTSVVVAMALVGCSDNGPKAGPGASPSATTPAVSRHAKSNAQTAALGDIALTTWPGAWCNVHPPNLTDADNSVPVVADPWGAARFSAVMAQPGDPVTTLEADCRDAAGAAATYAVDLTATATVPPVYSGMTHATSFCDQYA
jgi:hypothetical protein